MHTGDVLCEVENDKMKLILKATHDGVLAKILAPASSVRLHVQLQLFRHS